jgi:polyisoprenoid-binding protein YceI
MTTRQFLLPMAVAFAALFTSCTDAPKADSAEATEAQTVAENAGGTQYNANTGESKIEWVGTKPTGRHHGTFKIKDGYLTVANNMVTGGKFTIDMKSVTPDDQDDEGNKKLQGHLQSADFFDVEKYPDGIFEITEVKADDGSNAENRMMKDATHIVTGNLKLKDATKSISFPAKINVSDNQVTADANFNIDRTQWGINYQSDKSIQNKFIDHEVNLQLHLVANK